MECIILAGGRGTRLQSVVADVPKCMAPVNGQPFLHYICNYLEAQKCDRVILSLGYKHEHVLDWLKTQNRNFSIDHVIEDEPLGTGGGIQLAIKKAKEDNTFVLNGDTMFRTDLTAMFTSHQANNADTTLALKPMLQFERYGAVSTDADGRINAFHEKQYCEKGLINGGIYLIRKERFLSKAFPEKFSMEQDYFEAYVAQEKLYGFVSDSYFIDIGIPADYQQAQQDFKTF